MDAHNLDMEGAEYLVLLDAIDRWNSLSDRTLRNRMGAMKE
ncbi:MAG: hypothetical protein R8P61_27120 [Bacteroidia bacterium]|nr:hypothetical protein [Bacteroidia bacterium]